MPDWVVCDTIANGSRTVALQRGSMGGKIVRFERSYSAGGPFGPRAGSFRGTVAVLGELTRRGCFALCLLTPSKGGEKSGRVWDF